MQPISSPRRSRFPLVLRAALILVAVGGFGACDQHSAEEVPENYGHGSSHERMSPDHQVDSSKNGKSFSDTAGTKGEQPEKSGDGATGSPTPTPANHFY